MADKQRIALRFSEEIYATRQDVIRELRTSMVDTFWNDILDYREHFLRPLPLNDANNRPFHIVMCSLVQNLTNTVERKLNKHMMQYAKLKNFRFSTHQYVHEKLLSNILSTYAKVKGIEIDEETLIKLSGPNNVPLYENHIELLHFLHGYRFAIKTYQSPIDEDYLAKLYSAISGNNELTHLYREFDPRSANQNAIINKIYDYAPARYLEKMMGDLLRFIQSSNLPSIVKSIIVAYYIHYAKPFDNYNDEIAILLLFSLLAQADLDESAFAIDILNLFDHNDVNLDSILREVQKSNDITYFLIHALSHVEKVVDELAKFFLNVQMSEVKKEQFVEKKEETNDEPINLFDSLALAKKEEEEKIHADEKDESVDDESLEKRQVPLYQEAPNQAISIANLSLGLDEKDAQKLEEHLLESNPRLKRGEAYFYARHCTLGKYYTIAQYKKTLGCAYETARTSMETLVKEGYYVKEQIKNKFIYTPKKR